nr:CRISPR-associated protein, Cse3 family protein [Salmonella sp. NCTC 7297]
MYLSRIQLRFNNLRPEMLKKWHSARPYASHQWLWQLFPEQDSRSFLFREEPRGGFFYAFGYTAISGAFLVSH